MDCRVGWVKWPLNLPVLRSKLLFGRFFFFFFFFSISSPLHDFISGAFWCKSRDSKSLLISNHFCYYFTLDISNGSCIKSSDNRTPKSPNILFNVIIDFNNAVVISVSLLSRFFFFFSVLSEVPFHCFECSINYGYNYHLHRSHISLLFL